jgi:hypothetical protein
MFDESIEKTDRIEQILQGLNTERAAAPAPPPSEDKGDIDDPGPNEQ